MLKGKYLSDLLAEKAPDAYYVGGCLLDSYLGKYSGDIDLALPRAEVKQTAKNLGTALNAAVFEMDPEFCVWRITTKEGFQIDLSALDGDDILKDLPRRDFTINALALSTSSKPTLKLKTENGKTKVLLTDIDKNALIDLNKGQKAIKSKKIIANNSNVFEADPLRLFRAFRIAAERNFEIDKQTLNLIKTNASKANEPSGERIQEELKRLMRAPNTAHYLSIMEDLGLFKKLLPKLADQKNCAECYYGKGGVWKHTLLVVERIEFLLNNLKLCIPEFYKELQPFCQDHALYKMAALLHDIAKPETAKMKDGRLRFFYHEQQGAKRAECFLNDLRYSSLERRLICKMISS
ncbi:MAG: CCA tRNA nucleotidyltransferase, partial [Elusimicrobiaceae bacterium]|nr:CCA tRNA nucleotidyltransferase [Elusimicrobiaceae bacterium]